MVFMTGKDLAESLKKRLRSKDSTSTEEEKESLLGSAAGGVYNAIRHTGQDDNTAANPSANTLSGATITYKDDLFNLRVHDTEALLDEHIAHQVKNYRAMRHEMNVVAEIDLYMTAEILAKARLNTAKTLHLIKRQFELRKEGVMYAHGRDMLALEQSFYNHHPTSDGPGGHHHHHRCHNWCSAIDFKIAKWKLRLEESKKMNVLKAKMDKRVSDIDDAHQKMEGTFINLHMNVYWKF